MQNIKKFEKVSKTINYINTLTTEEIIFKALSDNYENVSDIHYKEIINSLNLDMVLMEFQNISFKTKNEVNNFDYVIVAIEEENILLLS